MKIELITKRLNIKNIISDDLKSDKFINEFKDFFIDKESSSYAIYDTPFPTDDIGIMKLAERIGNNGLHLAIRLKSSDAFIGYIFHIVTEPKKMGIGYAIHSKYQNKGYGTEAVRYFAEYVLGNSEIECILAGTANNNAPSVRMLEKLNFKKLFEQTQSHRKDEHGNPIEFIESLYSYEK